MGGSARGKKLLGPMGFKFRPATGRVKEFIFSYLGDEVEGARVLDLFCGTGSLGIEALSRGAKEIIFVDKSLQSVKLLKKNLENCGFTDRARIFRKDTFRLLRRMGIEGEEFDLILADPPFKDSLRDRIVSAVDENNLIKQEGFLILEHEFHDPDLREHSMKLVKQRRFGHCVVSVYG